MNDALFEVIKLEIKDMLSNAKYDESLDVYDDIASGRVEAFTEVLELLEDDKWK